MRYKILLPLCIFSSLLSIAQQKPDKAFAIVGASNNNYNWLNVQEIDLSTGEVTRNIYDKDKTMFQLFDAKTKKQLSEKVLLGNITSVRIHGNNFPKSSVVNAGTPPTQIEILKAKQEPAKSIELKKDASPVTVEIIKEGNNTYEVVSQGNANKVKSGVIIRRANDRNAAD